MKTLHIAALGILFFVATSGQAQVSVNVNIGLAPAWGPPVARTVEYYYLPEVQAYYDIRATQFIYYGQGGWIRSRNLPVVYRNYDLNRGRKIVLNDYHGRTPYVNYNQHKAKYYKGRPEKYYAYNAPKHYDKHNHYDNKKGKGHDKHKH